MIPNITIGAKTISAYMIMALIGILVSLFYSMHLAKKREKDEIRVLVMLLIAGASTVVGAHLLYALIDFDLLVRFFRELGTVRSFGDFLERVNLVFGGAVFYGGLLSGMLGGWLYLRLTKKERAAYMDLGAVAIPLFHGFGRIGCFLSGCCYGVPWAYGVTYRHSVAEQANGIARFPVQLVEALLNFGLFFLLRHLFLRGKMEGKLLLLYLLLYPAYRFLLEFYATTHTAGCSWGCRQANGSRLR